MILSFFTLDVFTNRAFGGNPLAVFCDAPELPAELMQKIAREFNLSETVFIVRPRDPRAARRLRIFTPARELPFAGHPTIGAAHALLEEGLVSIDGDTGSFVLEEEVGLVPIQAKRRDGVWFVQLTTATLPEEGAAAPSPAELAQLLNVGEDDLLAGEDFAQFFSCGVPFLFVPVRNRAVLGDVRIDTTASRKLQVRAGASQAYVFCYDPELSGSDIRARMFAEQFGIAEDPATGSAAAAFAGYLAQRNRQNNCTRRWTIEQGFEMGRPSLIYLEADVVDRKVSSVRVGGTAVRMSAGALTAM